MWWNKNHLHDQNDAQDSNTYSECAIDGAQNDKGRVPRAELEWWPERFWTATAGYRLDNETPQPSEGANVSERGQPDDV